MFGALEFSDKLAGYGIQPIIGCELAVDFGDQDPNARNALAAAPALGLGSGPPPGAFESIGRASGISKAASVGPPGETLNVTLVSSSA